jgi:hypothetical protein
MNFLFSLFHIFSDGLTEVRFAEVFSFSHQGGGHLGFASKESGELGCISMFPLDFFLYSIVLITTTFRHCRCFPATDGCGVVGPFGHE